MFSSNSSNTPISSSTGSKPMLAGSSLHQQQQQQQHFPESYSASPAAGSLLMDANTIFLDGSSVQSAAGGPTTSGSLPKTPSGGSVPRVSSHQDKRLKQNNNMPPSDLDFDLTGATPAGTSVAASSPFRGGTSIKSGSQLLAAAVAASSYSSSPVLQQQQQQQQHTPNSRKRSNVGGHIFLDEDDELPRLRRGDDTPTDDDDDVEEDEDLNEEDDDVINEEDESGGELSRDSLSLSSINSPINRMTIKSPLSSAGQMPIPTPKSAPAPMSSSFLANRINIINNAAAAAQQQNAAAGGVAQQQQQQQTMSNSPAKSGQQQDQHVHLATSVNSPLNGSLLLTPTATSGTSHASDMTPQNSVINKFSSTSRTQMKLQLMKQQTEQFDKKTTIASPPLASSMMLVGTTPQTLSSMISTASAAITSSATMSVTTSSQPMSAFTNQHLDNPSVLEDLNASLIEDLRKRSNSIVSQSGDSAPTLTQSAVTASSASSANQLSLSPQIIPRDIATQYFQVDTKLENPTTFHVMQMLNSSNNNSKSRRASASSTSKQHAQATPPTTSSSILKSSPQYHSHLQQSRANSLSIASPAVSRVGGPVTPANSTVSNFSPSMGVYAAAAAASSVGSSSVEVLPSSLHADFIINDLLSKETAYTPSNISSVTEDSSFSQNELDELEDFVGDRLTGYLRTSASTTDFDINDIKNETREIEQYLNMPSTLPSEAYFKMAPGSPVRPSSSCPADIVRLKKMHGVQLNDDEIRLILKDRQKKDSHNLSK